MSELFIFSDMYFFKTQMVKLTFSFVLMLLVLCLRSFCLTHTPIFFSLDFYIFRAYISVFDIFKLNLDTWPVTSFFYTWVSVISSPFLGKTISLNHWIISGSCVENQLTRACLFPGSQFCAIDVCAHLLPVPYCSAITVIL